ncbi:peptidylprolyl isomerase [Leptolyngbya sp. BL0902]|uniref:peptidylprolyl isomerase n=1 Tax=Leptolyngbya sp. BL0902 TaxID=1115757 RepID=UPI001938ECD9|nr:peptidylprolyl isomerase [Leptolyngbya sp. BL0902]QQE66526.1 peptidylprolyl isomerase [Leptolyngbya sp. BL0902]
MGLNTRLLSMTLAAMLILGAGACTAPPTGDAGTADSAVPAPTETTMAMPSTAGLPVLNGKATVEMVVNGSTIVIEVNGEEAPITAGNFVDLVNRGVYDGTSFHRVVREPQPFVVQGGDPQSTDPSVPAQMYGTGSFVDPDTNAPRYIPLEIKPAGAEQPVYSQTFEEARIAEAPQLTHARGAVAMARSQAPDSASAQFYFALADLPFLDGSYAVFGTVTEGMDVVDAIQQGDRIESARVVEGLDNLQTSTQP